jgi:hypothetical protein
MPPEIACLPPAAWNFGAAWGCGGAFCGDAFRSARGAGPAPGPPSRSWRAASSRGFGWTSFCCSRASRLRPVVCGCSCAAVGAARGVACRSAARDPPDGCCRAARALGGAACGVDACAGACCCRAARVAGAGAAFGAAACGAGAARAAGAACGPAACPGGPPPPFGAPAAGIAVPAERMIRSAVTRALDCNMTPAPASPQHINASGGVLVRSCSFGNR